MEKLLFVNACVDRRNSRTDRLARELIRALGDIDVEELVLEEMRLQPLDTKIIAHRDEKFLNKEFDDPVFELANKFSKADIVVIASPFWENCFNSMTKIFLEYAGAVGVSFRYSPEGMPIGMCKGEALYYVTTRGGPITDEQDMGYGVVHCCASTYGFKKIGIVSANALDIVTNDPEEIMEKAIAEIPSRIL